MRSTSSQLHVLHQRKKAKQRPHEDVSVDTETSTMAIHISPSAYMGDMLDEYNNSIFKTNHSWINKISVKVPGLWILYNAGNFISVRQKLPMWLSWIFAKCNQQPKVYKLSFEHSSDVTLSSENKWATLNLDLISKTYINSGLMFPPFSTSQS